MGGRTALALLTLILVVALVLDWPLTKLALWIAALGFLVGFISGVVGFSGPVSERLKVGGAAGLILAILLPLSVSLAVPLGIIALVLIAAAAVWKRLGEG